MPPKKDSPEQLLIAAAQKDPARFAELYEENFERIYAFVARRVRNRDDAEDITAEVFRDALSNLARFEWRGAPFAAWLYKIAANAIADRWHRAAKEQATVAADPPDSSAKIDPEEIERRTRLFRMVADLPNDQRRVIEMRFADGKSIREIAQELRRTDGAIKQLQFRGLRNLKDAMGKTRGRKGAVQVRSNG